jgi:hypothetical protein
MPVRSKPSVHPAPVDGISAAISLKSTLNASVPTRPLKPTRKLCASAKCGSNPYSLKPKTGTACGGSVFDDYGASTVRPCGSLLGKISSACSKSVAGDAARSQRMRCVPLFGFFCVRCLFSFWRRGRFWCRLVQLAQWSGRYASLLLLSLVRTFSTG